MRMKGVLLMVKYVADSTTVMHTGYIVPAKTKKPNKDLKLTPDMQKLLDKFKKIKTTTAKPKDSNPQVSEHDGYVRMSDGSLQKARIKFVPATTEAEKRDLWNKFMNKK